MQRKIAEIYGNRLRLRVVGLCWENDRLLLVNHRGIRTGDFWAPPGGGVEFGVPAETALKREVEEETGLIVQVHGFRFACELIKEPLHGVELFFTCQAAGGTLRVGYDPEMQPGDQIISDVRFFSTNEIQSLRTNERHGIFNILDSPEALKTAHGYFKI
jgi:8-oxo-dGTP diphosphatase